jgi:toxin HigB-1
VEIRNFLDKRLERLYSKNDPKGFPPEAVEKLRKMLDFLEAMENQEELRALPNWKAHRLSGDRKGAWSLHVTRNWRLTFRIDTIENEIKDVNYEDYH